MPDEYSSIFSSDPSTGALTYPQLEARRRIAIALATRNRPYPKTIGEGLTALGEGLGEGYMNRGLAQAEGAQRARDTAATSLLMGGAAPAPAAVPGRVSEAAPEEAVQPAVATADTQPSASMPIEEWKQRVARNESGGQKDPYSALGELSRRGDRAYGKYQVMGENVPKWTKQFVGREMTPEEFLADKDAQETVTTGMGGKYLAKYGPDGAARAWFAGEKGMNDPNRKDTLGTHVAEYSRRFNMPVVSRDQVVASAAKNPNVFAAASQMSPEAESAMAYAPEGAASEGAEGLGAGMLANLTNPQPPGLGLRGPSDSTFPAPAAAPAVSRDSIAAAVAQQQGVTPPQQVAAGPAPLPQAPPPVQQQAAPPALQRPAADPQPVDPGPEPRLQTFLEGNPQIKQQMQNARRIALDPTYSPAIQAQAQAAYQELEKRANDAYTKQWTLWHERTKTQEGFDLNARERQIKEETHRQAMQGTNTAAGTQQPVDPRVLGTPQSPQRSRIPEGTPKPAGISDNDWAKQQAPELHKAAAAVEDAEPNFKSMLRIIDEVRNHPGKAMGTGLFAGYAPRGTNAYAFSGGPEEGVVGQLKGQNFLAAYAKLKGGGSIANVEGTKAQQAQAAINPAAGQQALDHALDNLEKQIRSDLETVQRKGRVPVTAWQKSNEDEYAPDKGQIVTGFSDGKAREYLGGDPRDLKGSWRLAR